MHFFYRILKHHCCTAIMTGSVPNGQKTLGLVIQEFIVHVLLILDSVQEDVEQKRRLLTQKMRGTDHCRKWHNVLMIKQGLEIVSFAQV